LVTHTLDNRLNTYKGHGDSAVSRMFKQSQIGTSLGGGDPPLVVDLGRRDVPMSKKVQDLLARERENTDPNRCDTRNSLTLNGFPFRVRLTIGSAEISTNNPLGVWRTISAGTYIIRHLQSTETPL
jgi:hypothetical protein